MPMVTRDALSKVAKIIGGENAVKIIEVLSQNDEMTEEEIVAKTGIKINEARKILYKLYEHSIVGLRRTRDKDTGWFIFYWRVQMDQVEGFIISQKKRVLEKLENRLEYEKDHDFYYCHTPGCRRVTFEEATENLFRCPVCHKPLIHYDNSKIIAALSKKIERIKSELKNE
ncbi:MAG: transcription factor [Candidatus Bathyarchaeota archaeon]|nr:transcription factor [Candidatus Bathyarchaeota archaeon]